MAHGKSAVVWLALSAAMAILAIANAARMIGDPARWVDAVTILAFAFASGAFFGRAIALRREALTPPPEIPGGPPAVPK